MILVSMERGDPTLYYGTKQLYFGHVNFKFTEGPSLGRRVTKKAQEDGLCSKAALSERFLACSCIYLSIYLFELIAIFN